MNLIIRPKKCPDCKILKDLSDFTNDKSRPDGKTAHCRICRNKRVRERRANHEYKKRMNENKRNWRKKNRKRVTEQVLKRRRNNPQEKLRCALRSRMHKALKKGFKNGSAVQDLGCSMVFFS